MALRRLLEGVERSNDFLGAQAAWKHGMRSEEFYKKYGRTPETTASTAPDFSGAEEEPSAIKETIRTQVKTEDDLTPTVAVKERRQKKFGTLLKTEPTVAIKRESRHRQSYSSDRRRSRSRDRRRKRDRGHSSRHSNGRKRRRRSHGPPMRFPTPPRVLSKEYTSDKSSATSDSASHGRAPIKELADSGEALAKNPRILNALADLIMQRRGLKRFLPTKLTAIFKQNSQGKFTQRGPKDRSNVQAKNSGRRRTVDPPEIDDSHSGRAVLNPSHQKPKDEEIKQEQSIENMKFTAVNDGPLHKPKLSDIFDRLEKT